MNVNDRRWSIYPYTIEIDNKDEVYMNLKAEVGSLLVTAFTQDWDQERFKDALRVIVEKYKVIESNINQG